MTVIAPALGGAVTWKLQTLSPLDQTTWTDLNFASTSDGTVKSLSGYGAAGVAVTVVFPIDMFGGGNIRFVASSAVGADQTFVVLFTKSD